jgi:hypothetical protein
MFDDPKLARLGKDDPRDPPRSVPWAVRLRLFAGRLLNQLGWFFLGSGLAFVWLFGGSRALHDLVFFSGELAVTEGQVSSVRRTNVSINEQGVYAYHYTFRIGETTYSGRTKGFQGRYQAGGRAPIEYRVDDPARSRIRGLSTSSGSLVLFVVLFPAIGLFAMLWGVRKSIRGVRLLRTGKPATGVLVDKRVLKEAEDEETRAKFEYAFEFEAEDGTRHRLRAKTDMFRTFGADPWERYVQEAESGAEAAQVRVPVVHDPRDPEDALLLDDLPGCPRIDEQGKVRASGIALPLLLVVPLATVLGHAAWILHVLEVF